MSELPAGLQEVIDYFSRLPGVGKKTASRLAFSLLQKTPQYQQKFGTVLSDLHGSLGYCEDCFHLCEAGEEKCSICVSSKRETGVVCVVENSMDVIAMEQSHSYFGRYFVLGGVLSPMDGIGPNDIRVHQLEDLVRKSLEDSENPENSHISEVIFALSSTLEGESTSTYIWKKLENIESFSGKISRIARGIPAGSSLQYIDETTLSKAFEGRQLF